MEAQKIAKAIFSKKQQQQQQQKTKPEASQYISRHSIEP
jgi:hypothetical protein